MSTHTRCRHFNGVMKKCCKVGIDYDSFKADGKGIPCLPEYNPKGATCESISVYTVEELEAQEARRKRSMDLMARGLSSCCEEPFDTSRVITSGRHKGHGPRYCSKCKKLAFMV